MAGIDPRYYYLTAALLGICSLIGLYLAYSLQREVNDELAPTTEKDVIGPLEKAFYSGLMDEAEYQRIKASMARKKGNDATPAPKPITPRVKPVIVEDNPPPVG